MFFCLVLHTFSEQIPCKLQQLYICWIFFYACPFELAQPKHEIMRLPPIPSSIRPDNIASLQLHIDIRTHQETVLSIRVIELGGIHL